MAGNYHLRRLASRATWRAARRKPVVAGLRPDLTRRAYASTLARRDYRFISASSKLLLMTLILRGTAILLFGFIALAMLDRAMLGRAQDSVAPHRLFPEKVAPLLQ